jgi:hypothetical protein
MDFDPLPGDYVIQAIAPDSPPKPVKITLERRR